MENNPSSDAAKEVEASVTAILDDAWAELRRVSVSGERRFHVPQIGEQEAQRRSSVGRELLRRIETLSGRSMDTRTAGRLSVARYHARRWSHESEGYWTAFEAGGWFKSMFAPSGDALGRLVTSILHELRAVSEDDREGIAGYADAVGDLARVVRQLAERTRGQAERGIYMPRALLPSAVNLVRGLRGQVDALRPLATAASFEVAQIDRQLAIAADAFQEFEELLTGDYSSRCSQSVGIGQYPGGFDVYPELIYQNTTLSYGADAIHRRGIDEVEEIFERMKMLSARAGFSNVAEYRASLDADPAWRASTPQQVGSFFDRYIQRMDRVVLNYFHPGDLPRAGHGAQPLPAVLEDTLAYGYYDQPRPDQAKGYYLFNASNLMKRGLMDVGAFTFHELVPGHHVHFAGQLENPDLHPLQRHTFCNGFNEGWAEYGRRVAEEAGMYENDAEVFGGLCNDMRQATRLVVDTGLNVLGWTADRARDYIFEHSLIPAGEVDALINWYACEIPGQSVAYSLCRSEMLRLRNKAQKGVGAQFDIRDFHNTVLQSGARPFSAIEADVEARLRRP